MALLPVCLLSFAVSLVFVLPGGIADDLDPEEIFVRSFKLDSENCSSQVHCPRTLNEYANEVDQYFLDNTTFTFMPGIHQLSVPLRLDGLSNVVLRAMDAENVTLQVTFSSSESTSSSTSNNIVWTNCHNITIRGLNFNITGLPYAFDDTSGESDISVLEFRQGSSSIFLSDLTLRGSGRWRAIWLQNVDQVTISSLSVSGAMSNDGSAVHATQSSVDFFGHNSFMDNMATRRGGAISLSSTTYNFFENLSFSGNRADYGGAMYIEKCSLNISGTLNFCDNTALVGGAMLIAISAPNFTLSGTVTFVNNSATAYGGAISYDATSDAIISGTVLFINNTASGGGAIFIRNLLDNLLISGDISFFGNAANLVLGSEYGFGGAVGVLSGSVTFSGNVIFAENSAHRGGALILQYGTCHLSGFVTFENNTATLEGGAVLLHNYSPDISQKSMESQLYMTNMVKFLANSAEQGGAIAFGENTRLKLNTSLQAHFVNNRAEIYGGAIFVRSDATTDRMSCFAPPDTQDLNECFFALDSVSGINLNFSYNSAGEAGTDIFGGNLERCEVSVDDTQWDPFFLIRELHIVVFNSDNSITSNISSEPLRVYICDNDSNLMDSASLSIVRATEANLSVLIVGQDRGSVPSSVRISLNNDVSIDAARRIQDTGKTCTPVSYRLASENDTTSFTLFPDDGPCRGIGMHIKKLVIICSSSHFFTQMTHSVNVLSLWK